MLDGMDIALCKYNHANRQLQYSGANRPLWIIRKDGEEVEMIKPTRQSIGGFTTEQQKNSGRQRFNYIPEIRFIYFPMDMPMP
jgi:hypothetical protein